MFWLILIIIAVGYFVVKAINRSTYTNALIAQQKAEQNNHFTATDNSRAQSPEEQIQEQVSLNYFHHLSDIMDIKVRIAEKSIKLFNPPEFIRNFIPRTPDEEYVLTSNKELYEKTKKEGKVKIRYVSKQDILDAIKHDIQEEKELIKGLTDEYKKKALDFKGYEPEGPEIAKIKYGLDEPFAPDYESMYFNEDNTSSWSMFQEKKHELEKLEQSLNRLKDPKTRKQELQRMTKEKEAATKKYDPDQMSKEQIYDDAVKIVIEAKSASTSLLQRRLRIGYGQSARLIETMETNHIIGPADGSRPREVLINSLEEFDKIKTAKA